MGSSWKWNDFLTVGNVMVGVRSNIGGAATTSYFHADHLGSISAITDENGHVVQYLSYDPWGKRRFANGTDDPTDSITSQTTRGFTAQEELSVGGLVHLNGRVYDQLLGRMLSADPTVPDLARDPDDRIRFRDDKDRVRARTLDRREANSRVHHLSSSMRD